MRVLWVSGRLIGPAATIINSDYKGTSGGWIQTEYEELNLLLHLLIFILKFRR